jgi:F0F1-type ATP synthase epsilon subunit
MFSHRFTDEKTYQVVELWPPCPGGARIVPKDHHAYLAWLAEGNTPVIEVAGRFLSVVGGELVVDPDKASILAAEEAAMIAEKVAIEKKLQDVATAKEQITKIEADVGKATDLPSLKLAVTDLIKQVRILIT